MYGEKTMAERPQEIYRLPDAFFQDGCPLIIKLGMLQKDPAAGRILARLQIQNIGEKIVTCCKVSLLCAGPDGSPVREAVSHTYPDLLAEQGTDFGMETVIPVPEGPVCSFTPYVTEILFDDRSSWRSDSPKTRPVPKQKRIGELSPDPEILKQFRIDAGEGNCDYLPEMTDGFFFCTCGAVNYDSADKCLVCGRRREDVLALRDTAVLRRHAEKRAEQERKAAEETGKKRTKRIAILAAAVVLAGIALVVIKVVLPSNDYKRAETLLNTGNYEEAISAFTALGGYKDSADRIKEAEELIRERKYKKALDLVNAGSYEEAISAFTDLGGYRDSADRIKEAEGLILERDYRAAEDLLAGENYRKAMDAFAALGSYKDAKDNVEQIRQDVYLRGTETYGKGDPGGAKRLLSQIDPAYKQTDDYLFLSDVHEHIEPVNRVHSRYDGDEAADFDRLKGMMGFEDVNDLILSTYGFAAKYLNGKWKADTGGYTFSLEEESGIEYDLPNFDYGDYYSIRDGVLMTYVKDGEEEAKDLFRFTVTDWDTFTVYCYKNEKTYTLTRQQG